MENNYLFTNIRIHTLSQVTGTIALIQISNANRLQLTSNNINSTLGFSNTNSQKISNNDSNSTFNSAQLIGFPAGTADETPKSFFKACSHSKDVPSFQLSPFIYPYSTGRYVTWNYLVHSAYLLS
ncbi:hypothetical protein AVEN_38473-1 [Araneus ventricosus]|uniref:Uncharacterized protein n=1 Tax=Araneus ventricosus TaxID=182803 RepID=A0A4Y2H4U1_ARAVE|nr:hypothetical protein AVEN_38473-1 [Araneus ventricosus]